MLNIHENAVDKYLLFGAIIICSFSEGLKQLLFGLPVVHLGNLICIYLFAKVLVVRSPKILLRKDILPFSIWAAGYIIIGGIGFVVYRYAPLQFLWGVRTYLRMFLLLFDCILILEKSEIKLLCRMFDIVIVMHVVLTLIQFFVFGIRWDFLNGIFGTAVGDSSSLHAILLIDTCLSLYRFYCRTISVKIFMAHFIWLVLNSAMSEIRGWFYEIIVLVFVYILVSHDYKRILKLLPALAGVYLVGIILMGVLYPYTWNFLRVAGFVRIMNESHKPMATDGIGRSQQLSAMTAPILEYAKEKSGGRQAYYPS